MAPRLILALVVVVFSADCGKRAENSSSAPPSAPGPSSGQVIANAPATDQGNNAAGNGHGVMGGMGSHLEIRQLTLDSLDLSPQRHIVN
jgi:hypothetical protein